MHDPGTILEADKVGQGDVERVLAVGNVHEIVETSITFVLQLTARESLEYLVVLTQHLALLGISP